MKLIDNKKVALNYFIDRLLKKLEDKIAKIYLFGGLAKGKATKQSDIDIFIIVFNDLKKVEKECDRISFNTLLKYDEVIQPIVGCIDELRNNNSYFYNQVIREKKEVYSMAEERIRKKEALEFLELAKQYYNESYANLKLGNYRLLVDGAYNTIELCMKALLRLKGQNIPKRHSNIIQLFSKFYIKTDEIERKIGHRITTALRLRNNARYERHSAITKQDAQTILELAENLLKILEDKVI